MIINFRISLALLCLSLSFGLGCKSGPPPLALDSRSFSVELPAPKRSAAELYVRLKSWTKQSVGVLQGRDKLDLDADNMNRTISLDVVLSCKSFQVDGASQLIGGKEGGVSTELSMIAEDGKVRMLFENLQRGVWKFGLAWDIQNQPIYRGSIKPMLLPIKFVDGIKWEVFSSESQVSDAKNCLAPAIESLKKVIAT